MTPGAHGGQSGRNRSRLRAEATLLRAETARLRAEVSALRSRLRDAPGPAATGSAEQQIDRMREANENLVIAAIQSQVTADAAQRAAREREEFLAMLAHELRNPLAPIVGALAILRRMTHADPKLPWIHDLLKRQVDHLTLLLNDLLEVSRITSGKVTLKKRPVRVAEFMETAAEIARPLVASRMQQLDVGLPAEPLTIEGDPARLTQVFSNLLNNASKYTLEGGHITFTARREDGTVVLRVADDGVGIAADSLARVFDLFTQEGRSLERSQGGLGIGLTVVRGLVELHGGRVQASSPGEGQGSTFEATFPLQDPAPVRPIEAQRMADTSGERHRIAVIEDNVDANESLKAVLQLTGHEAFGAFDGIAGETLVRELHPAIVLCDIGLPGQDGFQLIAKLKATVSPMPLMIAISGYGQPESRRAALDAGFDMHLTKPVDMEALLRLLAAHPRGPGGPTVGPA